MPRAYVSYNNNRFTKRRYEVWLPKSNTERKLKKDME